MGDKSNSQKVFVNESAGVYYLKSDLLLHHPFDVINRLSFKPRADAGEILYNMYRGLDLGEIYNENIKYNRYVQSFDMQVAMKMQTDEFLFAAAQLKEESFSDVVIPLPNPTPIDVRVSEAIARRRSERTYSDGVIRLETLSNLLYYSYGVTGYLDIVLRDGTRLRKPLLASPTAGGLQSIELFFAARKVEGLKTAIYRYNPYKHALEVINDAPDIWDKVISAFPGHPYIIDMQKANLVFLLVAFLYRVKLKYGERGYKLALLDAGHLAQNILVVSAALGIKAVPVAGYYEDEIDALLNVDGVNVTCLHTVVGGV